MKKILTAALFLSMFLSFPTLPSFAKTVNPVHHNQRENSYLGYVIQGNYTISIYGDLSTHIVSGARVYVTSTGYDVDVDFIQNGGVFENNGVITANVKIYTVNGDLIRISSKLTK